MTLIDSGKLAEYMRCNTPVCADGEALVNDILGFCGVSDPVHAAGGVYCRECAYWQRFTQINRESGACRLCRIDKHQDGFCSSGKAREALSQ